MTIAAVVLAAGSSSRLGRPKQLLPCDGEPLVRVIAQRARAACDAACVVLGAQIDDIWPALAELDVDVIECTTWSEGMSASLRTGVRWARDAGHEAIVICACDQPRLTTEHVARLIAERAPIVASRYAGTLGIPALFGAAHYDELLALDGDRGARALLRARDVTAIDWPDGAFDLDTPEAVAAFSL